MAKMKGRKSKHKEKKENGDNIIELRVQMHCQGCAREVKNCLIGFPGVEEVEVDANLHKVIVRGKTADPIGVFERVKEKSRRKTELVSPLPKKEEGKESKEKEQKDKDKPKVKTIVIKVGLHCLACAPKVIKAIMKMDGVESVEPDVNEGKMTVKGIVDPLKLVEHIYKKTGKHAEIIPPPKKRKSKKGKKNSGGGGDEKDDESYEGVEGGKDKHECGKPFYVINYCPAPDIFSDENPNACSIM